MYKSNEENYTDRRSGGGRKRTGRGSAVLLCVLILAAIAIVGTTIYKKKTTFNTWEVVKSTQNISDASVLKTEDGFVLYNHDGAEGHSGDGTVLWNISYNMNNPIADACKNYAAFADSGAQEVRITDGKGANYVINVSEPIRDVCVAGQGVTAIRTDGGTSDHIYVYSIDGNQLLDIKTEVRRSGFPIAMDLSEDGTKLVTSYTIVGDEQESWLTFYNFGDVGQNYADKIVGSFSFKGEILPYVKFSDETHVVAADDKRCIIYKFREIPEQLKQIEGSIATISCNGDAITLATETAGGLKKITSYSSEGAELTSVETGVKYNQISTDKNELIISMDSAFVIFRKNGQEKIRAGYDEQIELIFSSGVNECYTIVGTTQTKVIRLKSKSEENQGLENAD